MTAPHPAVIPVIEALRQLADYRPSCAADLADVLKSVNDLTNPANVLDALADALTALGQHAEHDTIASHLEDAAGRLADAAEHIDRARADTGHWDGSGNGSHAAPDADSYWALAEQYMAEAGDVTATPEAREYARALYAHAVANANAAEADDQ